MGAYNFGLARLQLSSTLNLASERITRADHDSEFYLPPPTCSLELDFAFGSLGDGEIANVQGSRLLF